MSGRRLLVRFHPRDWRQRYGDEYLAVLEQVPMRPGVVIDVLRGVVEAHLGGVPGRSQGARRGLAVVLTAFVALCFAGAGFQKTVEDGGWHQHRMLGVLVGVTAGAALVALAALGVLGAIVLRACARGRERSMLLTAAVPVAAALTVLLAGLGLAHLVAVLPATGPHSLMAVMILSGFVLLVALAAGAALAAALRLVHRAPLARTESRVAAGAALLAAAAMEVVALAIAAWVATLVAVDPSRLRGGGGALDTTLWPTLALVVGVATAASVVAARAGVRGWREAWSA